MKSLLFSMLLAIGLLVSIVMLMFVISNQNHDGPPTSYHSISTKSSLHGHNNPTVKKELKDAIVIHGVEASDNAQSQTNKGSSNSKTRSPQFKFELVKYGEIFHFSKFA